MKWNLWSRLIRGKEILRNVEEVLKSYAIQRTKENNHFYDRFMIHLNYFLDYLDRSRDDNQSLLDMEDHIKQSYQKSVRDWFQDL